MIFELRRRKKIVQIPVVKIRPCRTQARKIYDLGQLKDLARSIENNGLLQPVIVRKVTSSEYELIAGERRLRACVICGKKKIPCIVMSCSDDEAMVYSLEENTQRADLNFIEEAQGVRNCISSGTLSQNEASLRLGRAPEAISELTDILDLDESERDLILRHHLTFGHAKALLRIKDKTERRIALSEVIANSMNISQAESYADECIYFTKQERLLSQRHIGILRDIAMFENTIKKAVLALNISGIDAQAEECEYPDHIEYVISIPKKVSAMKIAA